MSSAERSTDPNRYPPGWNREQVERVIDHYERQSDEEAAAEDEAAFSGEDGTLMVIPFELVPAVRELLAQHAAERQDEIAKDKRH